MSKITNDGLTRSGTVCFIAVAMSHYGNSIDVKGLKVKCWVLPQLVFFIWMFTGIFVWFTGFPFEHGWLSVSRFPFSRGKM